MKTEYQFNKSMRVSRYFSMCMYAFEIFDYEDYKHDYEERLKRRLGLNNGR